MRQEAYLPALDGLRALAVLVVIGFHFEVVGFGGGFLGVDLFFVLSGFLITRLLLAEHRTHGRIDLKAFWLRRARRLLPALFFVLGTVALVTLAAGATEQRSRIAGDGWSVLAYVSNWRFILGGENYWDQFSPSPLRHTWSLAIEEQFYLLWPLLVVGTFAVVAYWARRRARRAADEAQPVGARRTPQIVLGVALGGVILSAIAMPLVHALGGATRAYYGTDTRVQAMLAGCALAAGYELHPHLSPGVSAGIRRAAGGGLAVMAVLFVMANEAAAWMYRGGFTVAAGLATLIIGALALPVTGPLGACFSWAPLRFIGRISYGLYLWHWPVLLALTPERAGTDGFALFVMRFTLSFGLAAVMFHLLENRIRFVNWQGWLPRAAVPASVVALVAAFAIVSATSVTPISRSDGLKLLGSDTQVAAATPGAVRTLVLGDSLSGNLASALGNHSGEYGLDVVNGSIGGCEIARGEKIRTTRGLEDAPACDWEHRWPEMIERSAPGLIVLVAGSWDLLDRKVNGDWLAFGTPEWDAFYASEFDAATGVLARSGARVVVSSFPPVDMQQSVGLTGYQEHDNAKVRHLNELIRAGANRNGYGFIDLFAVLAPDGEYHQKINDIEVRHEDRMHLSPAGIEYVGQQLAPQLAALLAANPLPTTTALTAPADSNSNGARRVILLGDQRLTPPLAAAIERREGDAFEVVDPRRQLCAFIAETPGCPPAGTLELAVVRVLQPDVVVVALGPEDAGAHYGLEPGSDDWGVAVAQRLDARIAPFRDAGIPVVFVRTPAFGATKYAWTEALNAVLVAAARNQPDAIRIAELGVLSWDGYHETIDNVVVRTPDGVGLTDAGADRVVEWIAPEVHAVA